VVQSGVISSSENGQGRPVHDSRLQFDLETTASDPSAVPPIGNVLLEYIYRF